MSQEQRKQTRLLHEILEELRTIRGLLEPPKKTWDWPQFSWTEDEAICAADMQGKDTTYVVYW